jgi:hypothetical protein
MRDAAEVMAVTTAKLRREMDERECKRRNALSKTSPGLVLRPGDCRHRGRDVRHGRGIPGRVQQKGRARKDSCDWMGVLYPTEIEVMGGADSG